VNSDPLDKLSPADWNQLSSLADRIAADPAATGKWVAARERADGVIHVGYVRYGPIAHEFLEFMEKKDLVIRFDWPGWTGTEVVSRKDTDTIALATPEDALKYLTVMMRADRFSEGTLLDAFERGLVSTALTRVLTHPRAPRT
jgi:hypothetical protein